MKLETTKCLQCGLFHPVLPPNTHCPLSQNTDKKDICFSDIITNFNNILQENKNRIDDISKFKTYIQPKILEVVMNYKEK